MKMIRFSVAALATLAVATTSAFAQDPAAGGAGAGRRQGGGAGAGRQGGGQGGGFGGFGGGQGFGRGGMFGGQQDVTLASAPAGALATALKLTPEVKTQVSEIQQALREQAQQQMQEMFQGLQGGGGDQAARQEMMQQIGEKRKTADTKASKAIEALLSDEQKTMWPDVKKKWDIFQKAGLQIDLGEALMLTPEQLKALETYAKNRPAPGAGGPGGRRGGGA